MPPRENVVSPTQPAGLSLDDGLATWDVLSHRLGAFIQRWEADQSPPPLADFIPDGPLALRQLVFAELVKVDLEYRWSRGQPRRIEEYLSEHPRIEWPAGVPCDLIFEEFQVRRRC